MNCEEVANHFSDYFDKSLDTATMTRVATHIIACPLCRAESHELADCIEQVAGLASLDPPLGFAQRVMAHVREIEAKPTLWQWLFQSWSKSIPLPTTALVLVAIMAVFLYQKEEPLKQTPAINLPSQPAAATATAGKERPASGAALTPATLDSRTDKKPTATVQASPAPQIAAVESRLEANEETPRKPPIRALEVTTGREANAMFGFGSSLPLGEMRQLAPRSVPMTLENSLPLGDRIANFEFIVRRRAQQGREQVDSSSADAAPNVAGRRTALPIESIAEIRFYNVAPEHFEIFKKELAAEAQIESEPKAGPAPTGPQLLIKVTILPPDPAATTR